MTLVPLALVTFARRLPAGWPANSNASIRLFYAGNNGFSYDRPARSAPKVKWEFHMIIRRLALVLCCLGLPAVVYGLHAQAKPEPMAITPSEMKWEAQGGLAMAGMEQVNLVGNPSKPGPYTLRLKFPAGYKLAPHTHPDYREVTILSGTWYTGYGEKFDEAALKALPAGSFYTEPANVAHFVEVREPVMIQVKGTGPSGRTFVNPAENPK
jgi:quercetin dioxygenase-like cupin family protein